MIVRVCAWPLLINSHVRVCILLEGKHDNNIRSQRYILGFYALFRAISVDASVVMCIAANRSVSRHSVHPPTLLWGKQYTVYVGRYAW